MYAVWQAQPWHTEHLWDPMGGYILYYAYIIGMFFFYFKARSCFKKWKLLISDRFKQGLCSN